MPRAIFYAIQSAVEFAVIATFGTADFFSVVEPVEYAVGAAIIAAKYTTVIPAVVTAQLGSFIST